MKKTYVKPEMFYENFELSRHIATCAWDMSNFNTKEACSAVADGSLGFPEGWTIFQTSGLCADTSSEAYCWTNGSSSMNVFNS